MSKANTVTKLEVILENSETEEVVQLLADYMSGKELSEFLEFVKEELEN